MLDVDEIVKMQIACVELWHEVPIGSDEAATFAGYDHGYYAVAVRQHRFNYDLWHEEDVARSPEVTDARIAQVKRAIDRLNQARNDWIEKIDDWLTEALASQSVQVDDGAKLNTETPGSAVDRLSIMSLRIYHLREQLARTDVDAKHIEKVELRLRMCLVQQKDLANSLKELLEEIVAGRKRHRTYRQYKMYNDPTLNPQIYQAKVIAS